MIDSRFPQVYLDDSHLGNLVLGVVVVEEHLDRCQSRIENFDEDCRLMLNKGMVKKSFSR